MSWAWWGGAAEAQQLAGAAPQAITGVHFADADTFGTAVLTTGAVNITGVKYTDADTFHTAVLSTGPVNITGVHFSDADTFHTAVISTGAVNITGVHFADPDTFGAATITATAPIDFMDMHDGKPRSASQEAYEERYRKQKQDLSETLKKRFYPQPNEVILPEPLPAELTQFLIPQLQQPEPEFSDVLFEADRIRRENDEIAIVLLLT